MRETETGLLDSYAECLIGLYVVSKRDANTEMSELSPLLL